MFATRAGWLDKHEVTEVWYDPERLAFAKLLQHGIRRECAQRVWATTPAQLETATAVAGDQALRLDAEPRPDAEPKYYLRTTPLRHVPMTPAQAARCNAELAPDREGEPERWLSARQLALLAKVRADPERKWPIAVDLPLDRAWAQLETAQKK